MELALARHRRGPGAERLAALTLQRLEALAGDLRRFVDKHDHRARAVFTVREAESWTTALALVAGRPELFGHQMAREAADAGSPEASA
jgi:hypothetical protein